MGRLSHCLDLPLSPPNVIQELANTPVQLHDGVSVGTGPAAPPAELPAGVGRAVGGVRGQVEEVRRAGVVSAQELQSFLCKVRLYAKFSK